MEKMKVLTTEGVMTMINTQIYDDSLYSILVDANGRISKRKSENIVSLESKEYSNISSDSKILYLYDKELDTGIFKHYHELGETVCLEKYNRVYRYSGVNENYKYLINQAELNRGGISLTQNQIFTGVMDINARVFDKSKKPEDREYFDVIVLVHEGLTYTNHFSFDTIDSRFNSHVNVSNFLNFVKENHPQIKVIIL